MFTIPDLQGARAHLLIALRALVIPRTGLMAWRPGYSIPKLPGRCCHVCADSKGLEGVGQIGQVWSGLFPVAYASVVHGLA